MFAAGIASTALPCMYSIIGPMTILPQEAVGAGRGITSVATRVQSVSLRGNETPEMASSTELLPLDWSPHTTI